MNTRIATLIDLDEFTITLAFEGEEPFVLNFVKHFNRIQLNVNPYSLRLKRGTRMAVEIKEDGYGLVDMETFDPSPMGKMEMELKNWSNAYQMFMPIPQLDESPDMYLIRQELMERNHALTWYHLKSVEFNGKIVMNHSSEK